MVVTVPEYLMERFDYNLTKVYNFRVKAWAPTHYYRDSVLPKLLEEKWVTLCSELVKGYLILFKDTGFWSICCLFPWHRVIRISPFANRLSFDAPRPVQRFRCLANNVALRFAKPILTQGKTLVKKMKELSANNAGKYVSVHLRFEEVCYLWRRNASLYHMAVHILKKQICVFAGYGSFLLLCIWWWQPRKKRYDCG